MVGLQDDPPTEQSSLAEATPISDPVDRATPRKENLEVQGRASNKRKWSILLLGIVSIVVAILASSISIRVLLDRDPHKMEHLQIRKTILDAFGEDYFDNPQKERALHWMMYEDPRNGLNIEEKDRRPIQYRDSP